MSVRRDGSKSRNRTQSERGGKYQGKNTSLLNSQVLTASPLYESSHNNPCSSLIKKLAAHVMPRGKNYTFGIVGSSEMHHVSDNLAGYDNRVIDFAIQKVGRSAVRNSLEDSSPRCLLFEIRVFLDCKLLCSSITLVPSWRPPSETSIVVSVFTARILD